MDWLYLGLMIAFVLVSVALVHGFEKLRPGSRTPQTGGNQP
jgi:hypothetical protein